MLGHHQLTVGGCNDLEGFQLDCGIVGQSRGGAEPGVRDRVSRFSAHPVARFKVPQLDRPRGEHRPLHAFGQHARVACARFCFVGYQIG